MTAQYDLTLVLLSVVIGILASYAALGFAAQTTTASGSTRMGWLTGGAVVMGGGIWSMHFVGMLAYHIPVTVSYNLALLILSIAVAIGASLLALLVVSGSDLRAGRLLPGGLLMGVAIAGMHYIGMESMRAEARMSYSVPIVAVSVLIAIVASVAALWLAFRFRTDDGNGENVYKPLAAGVMGLAISGMHYTGMAAVHFTPSPQTHGDATRVLGSSELGQTIAAITLVLLILAIIGSIVERRILRQRLALMDQLERQALQLRRQKLELESQTEELTVQAETLASQGIEQEELNAELTLKNKELETALEDAETARTGEMVANDLRKKFVNMTSHELRTPLGAIGGYVQLLLMGLRGPLDPQVESDLKRIEVNQKHCLRLINEILDLARLEAGQMPLHMTELEFQEILEDARPMIEPQLLAKDIAYTGSADGPLPRVICDREKVQQILINLVSNSIKFTPPSGSIQIRAKATDTDVEFRISDSGPGIPADKVGALFLPYEQLGSETQNVGGTGLGLTLSRELARAMGGELRLDEHGGPGATFVLSLHAAPDQPPS